MEWLRDIPLVGTVIVPLLDVIVLAVLIYLLYKVLVQTRAVQLVRGGVFFGVLFATAYLFQLSTLQWLLNFLAPYLVIALAIIFQPELRKIFTRIGQNSFLPMQNGAKRLPLTSLVDASTQLSSMGRGALMVISNQVGLKNIIETGTSLDAEISPALILSIFAYDTALHDGAVVIENERIAAAGCFLPLSEQADIRRSFGTRHRAALGLAEESDALVLVVSEETGALSLAHNSLLYYDLEPQELVGKMAEILKVDLSEVGGDEG